MHALWQNRQPSFKISDSTVSIDQRGLRGTLVEVSTRQIPAAAIKLSDLAMGVEVGNIPVLTRESQKLVMLTHTCNKHHASKRVVAYREFHTSIIS